MYVDLYSLQEDDRIDMIGNSVTVDKKSVAFVVDDEAKADRYIEKLKKKFPSISVLARLLGPGGTVFVKVAEHN